MDYKNVTVIIPVLNEQDTITRLIEKIRSLYPGIQVLVVNDGSTDNTEAQAKDAGAIVASHPENMGNGAAVKTGIRRAKTPYLVFMDGDGQHKPENIKDLLDCLPEYDMVVGKREFHHQATKLRGAGNRVFNRLASYVTRFPVEDLTSGFRAIKTEIAKGFVYLLPNTYSYPSTLTLSVLRSGRTLKYIPIEVTKRKSGKSNIRIFADGLRFFMIIMKICTLYSPLRIFIPVSLGIFFLGLLRYLHSFITMGRFTNMSALMFSTAVIIFMMGLISEQICQMKFENSELNISYDTSENEGEPDKPV